VLANSSKYLNQHLPMLIADQVGPGVVFLSWIVAALAVVGWALHLRRQWRLRGWRLAELFFPAYLGLIFLWPDVWSGERFLLPALPLVLGYAGYTLAEGARWATPRAVAPAGITATVFLLLLGIPATTEDARAAALCRADYDAGRTMACLDPVWQEYFELARWSGRRLPPDAAFFTRKDRLWYAFSDRAALPVPMTRDPREFFRQADRSRVRYVVIDQIGDLTRYYITPIVLAHPEAFCLMVVPQEFRITGIFGIRPPEQRPAPATRPAGAEVALDPCPASYYAGSPRS
jgi:hypothetical protein